MVIRVDELHAGWNARGLPPLNVGIGINSGEMSIGNMGSEERFDYTIMGDHVNLASRLEGINKQYGTNIVISEFTYNLIRNESFLVRELDCVRVKGKSEPVTIYQLLGYDIYFQQMRPLVAMFGNALDAYQRRQWVEAMALFQDVLQAYPDDQPSKLYIERCKKYRFMPPPDDWDGVFEMQTK
jgi:adenylate cyclase